MIQIKSYDIQRKNNIELELVHESSIKYENDTLLDNPEKVANFIRNIFNYDKAIEERLHVIALNNRAEVLGVFELSHGDSKSSAGNIAGLFKRLLLLANCNYFILTHNHPSNNCMPSDNDIKLTERAKDAGKLLDINLLDHIIITSSDYYSFKNNNKID